MLPTLALKKSLVLSARTSIIEMTHFKWVVHSRNLNSVAFLDADIGNGDGNPVVKSDMVTFFDGTIPYLFIPVANEKRCE